MENKQLKLADDVINANKKYKIEPIRVGSKAKKYNGTIVLNQRQTKNFLNNFKNKYCTSK